MINKSKINRIPIALDTSFLIFLISDAPTLVDVNIFIRSFSNIDDVKMVKSFYIRTAYLHD